MSRHTELTIEPVAAFHDNYIWLLARGRRAVLVDPGSAAAARAALAARGLDLEAILVTHHHGDHIGGVEELAAAGARVFGPAREDIAHGACGLRDGETVRVLEVALRVLDVPGHTAGHIAFHAPDLDALFSGDTLFGCGCGRLFEGTPAQMLDSLRRLAALPGTTRVYCAHEYTLANLRFALEVEPDNRALQERRRACQALRERGQPTVPSTIDEERATNPFLRTAEPAVRAAAERRQAGAGGSELATFTALRAWKDGFRTSDP